MSPLGIESDTVQYPLLNYAKQIGWSYLSPEAALDLRAGESGLLLQEVFLTQVQRLNPGVVDYARAEDLAKRLKYLQTNIQGNLDAWEYMRGLKTLYIPSEKRERNVELISPDWRKNAYHVTNEFRFFNGTHHIRLDVACFINGIPVLMVETKAATKLEGIADALEQVRRYHREGPELMALMQLYTLTHLVQFYYGPTWSLSRKSLFNWKDQSAGVDFESLVKSFLHPQRLTRLITDFILFTQKDGELSKVILRPHQMRAVERVVQRAADSEKHRGLVWHTQGSGKTYTMITAAKQILENPIFENPTVLMIVDRNELEAQLFGNLASVGFGQVTVADSKLRLRELLEQDYRGLIVSMIHKFEGIPADLNTRDNVFVLVDEAHRTTGGDLGNYLMAALPKATYIGFTGTPIDKTAYGKGTFVVFGRDDEKGYLDKYSIAESIQDNTTVPLHYALAPNDLRVDRVTLEKEFLNLVEAEGMSDIEELNQVLDKAVNLRNMLKNKDRMVRVAQHIAQHFKDYVEPMGYKAFVVAVDREACAWYKDLLDQYLPPEYSEVIYSPGHNDTEDLSRFHYSDDKEKNIRKNFCKSNELPKILIVTEKLLTGFDAPVLYCMYLDKPMRDHVLLQAIARVNRPYEDEKGLHKPAGFVLDYVGIFENLKKALAFDNKDVEDIESVVTDIQQLKIHFSEMMQKASQDYLSITNGFTGDKAAEKVLDYFRGEETRHEFYRFFREMSDLYEIISPDPFLSPFIDSYDQLSRMYRLLRSAYEALLVDKELTRKTAQLVQEHTFGGAIQNSLEIYEINEQLLEKIKEDNTPDTVKIFNLLKTIQNLIAKQANIAPYLLSIGDKAEAIIQAYQLRQKATQEALTELEELIKEINEAERERAEKNFKPLGFAVYWLLNREGLPNAESIAREMEKTFDKYPHWRVSSAQERDVRKALYKILIQQALAENKLDDEIKETNKLTSLVDQLITTVTRAGA